MKTIKWEPRIITSEPNLEMLRPTLDREMQRANSKEQDRCLAANASGPRQCRLLGWLQRRDPKRLHQERDQKFYHDLLTCILLREDTKRIVLHQPQYSSIIESPYPVPDEVAQDLHWPFDQHIYIELDNPVISQQHDDRVDLHQGIAVLAGPEPRWVLNIFTSTQVNWLGCSAGRLDLPGNRFQALNEDIDRDSLQPAERSPYVRLVAYMTAKGIEIIDHPTRRNTARLLARRKLPNPWHVIQVEPRLLINAPNDFEETESRQHSYRYDVAGHIRFGRHRLKDSTHRTTREWVRPHQRGLANAQYIPATRRYSGEGPSDLTGTGEDTRPDPEPPDQN